MRRLPPILFAMLLIVLPLAAAASPMLRSSDVSAAVGDAVTIEWSGLPGDAHEVEFELSVDGGRWIRISPELEAYEGRFVWTVPAGLSGEARIRLRYGREREEHEGGEITLTLLAPASASRPDMARATGEWWCIGEHDAAPRSSALEGAPRIAPTAISNAAVPNDPTPAIALAESASTPSRMRDATPGFSASARAFVPPRNAPLRN